MLLMVYIGIYASMGMNMSHIFTMYFISGQYRGKTLLGIGTGPVVKDVITASQWFDEVFLSDISIDNVAFLQKWKSGDSEAIDAMKYQMIDFALREGKG